MKERPKIELICAHTGEKFLKDRREYHRQLRNGATLFYKDKKTAWKAINEKRIVKDKILEKRLCKKCLKPFDVISSKKASHFCSRSCCSSWNWEKFKKSDEYEDFVQNAARNCVNKIATKTKIVINECPICNKKFVTRLYKTRKTCSKFCHGKLISINSKINPNCGGETNYKKYSYKKISMDSSWEVEIAKWMDGRNINWIRSRKLVFLWTDENGNKRRYYPDFYLPKYNIYLDPKNKFLIEKDKFKIEMVQRENNIKVICGDKDYIINYLQNNLGNSPS